MKICLTCVETCHSDHQLSDVLETPFICDCVMCFQNKYKRRDDDN